MKYKVGDVVKYHATERTEKTCECCGNVDTEYKEITRTGIIEKASLEFVYTVANGFIHDNEKVQPDGLIVHFPSITPTDVLNAKVPVYRINGESMTEQSIIGLT